MTDDIVIRAEHLWKRYGLPVAPAIRNAWRRLRGHTGDDGPWAIRDLSLEVRRGETLGVIGRNGAGKSTLLKVLAGVTPPSRGHVKVFGSIFPMIELNAGLHPDLTGRENVYLLGAVMGLSTGEIKRLMPEVEAFCELDEWFDRSVRMYSSGMLARLGFAVAVNVDANVLLVDEVLAVGDITFQRKCFDRIERLHHSGKTVIFVSHSIRQVERLCDRVLLMERGAPVACGAPVDVISEYYQEANLRILESYTADNQKVRVLQERMEDELVRINSVRLLDSDENPVTSFATGDDVNIELHCSALTPIDGAIIGIGIFTVDTFFVAGLTSESAGFPFHLDGDCVIRCTIKALPLLSGIYTLKVKVKAANGGTVGGGTGLAIFQVTLPGELRLSSDYGLVYLDSEWICQSSQRDVIDHPGQIGSVEA